MSISGRRSESTCLCLLEQYILGDTNYGINIDDKEWLPKIYNISVPKLLGKWCKISNECISNLDNWNMVDKNNYMLPKQKFSSSSNQEYWDRVDPISYTNFMRYIKKGMVSVTILDYFFENNENRIEGLG